MKFDYLILFGLLGATEYAAMILAGRYVAQRIVYIWCMGSAVSNHCNWDMKSWQTKRGGASLQILEPWSTSGYPRCQTSGPVHSTPAQQPNAPQKLLSHSLITFCSSIFSNAYLGQVWQEELLDEEKENKKKVESSYRTRRGFFAQKPRGLLLAHRITAARKSRGTTTTSRTAKNEEQRHDLWYWLDYARTLGTLSRLQVAAPFVRVKIPPVLPRCCTHHGCCWPPGVSAGTAARFPADISAQQWADISFYG